MKYKTPDDGYLAYFTARLKLAAQLATQEIQLAVSERERWPNGKDKYIFDPTSEIEFVNKTQSELDDYTKNGYTGNDIDLMLWVRLATLTYSNIEIDEFSPSYSDPGDDLFGWIKWLSENESIRVRVDFDDFKGGVIVESGSTSYLRSPSRKKIKRTISGFWRYWIAKYDEDIDPPYDDTFYSLIIHALIKAYDVGIWGPR